MAETSDPVLTQVQRERDFYRHLLDLGTQDELGPFITEALGLIAHVAGAQRGYLELYDGRDGPGAESFWAVYGCPPDEATVFRAGISQGVITEALASRTTINSISALDDPRFRDRASVRHLRIPAVLCTPILAGAHFGVIYLHGRDAPGPFTEADCVRAETFARHVAAFADRLLLRRRYVHRADPTQPHRKIVVAPEIVGSSDALARALREAALAVPVDASVLITGATGTGKTMLARALHRSGKRCDGPFVELNCAAIPEALFESELFGALPGAHSTALRRIDGKVAAAERGVLFLDEIGEMSLTAQAKLLQLLQSKEYYPLGSPRPLKADVRVIAATNTDLKAAAARKAFREDLLYRLQVLSIRMPTLAERIDDIPALIRHARDAACETYGLPVLDLSPAVVHGAQAAEWPGNARQLCHAVEAAVIRASSENARQIETRHLFPEAAADPIAAPTYQDATREFQRRLLRQTLDDVDWNITEAARKLDIGRSYLYRLLTSFGLSRDSDRA